MKSSERGEAVDRSWLVGALEHARSLNLAELVDYLETVADDVVFETEMAARRSLLLSRLAWDEPR
jgi:hypothetical protein